MPKLKSIEPLIANTVGPIIAPPAGSRDQQRNANQPWRRWYYSKRWRALRLEVLERDGWRCQQTGVRLIGQRHAPNSPVVDHIKPHRGDAALFWDKGNLQAVSKEYHDGEKQRLERQEHP